MAGVAPIDQYVIDKVREMRKQIKASQADIAFALDTSEGVIGDIESTTRNAKYSLDHINRLAIFFKCSPRDFLPEKPLQ
jgi:transcriptional regulator with XRE-family HTH domain